MGKKRELSLDILRAIACIMVLGVHLGQNVTIPGIIGRFFEKGSTGVGVFFVLSGYLAYRSLEGVSFVDFWKKRAIRILPLYYLCILFYFVFYTATNGVPSDGTRLYWIRYLFLINLWVKADSVFWSNLGALWTISVFVFFYLIVPFYRQIVKSFLPACCGFLFFYLLMKLAGGTIIDGTPLVSMYYFCFGIVLDRAFNENKEKNMAVVLGLLILFMYLTNSGEALMAPFVSGIYIIATKGLELERSTWTVCNAFSYISMISYSVYLIHPIVLLILNEFKVSNSILFVILFLGITLAISSLSYNFIEKRFADYLMSKCAKSM